MTSFWSEHICYRHKNAGFPIENDGFPIETWESVQVSLRIWQFAMENHHGWKVTIGNPGNPAHRRSALARACVQ